MVTGTVNGNSDGKGSTGMAFETGTETVISTDSNSNKDHKKLYKEMTILTMAGTMTTTRTTTAMIRQDEKDNNDNKKGRQKGKGEAIRMTS